MTDIRYDVVVVGAGPAGSMAARAAAMAGAKTLLLERDPNIGMPVRCGEAVALKSIGKFFKLDDRMVAAEITGANMVAPDGTAVSVNLDGESGAILERSLFDRYLAETAADAGSEIWTRSDVEGLIMDDGHVRGVKLKRFNQNINVHADVIIAADGVESRLGRWAGIRTQLVANRLASAYQIVISGIDYDHTKCHFYFGADVSPGGYLWIFPKGERIASVGIGVDVVECETGEAYRMLTKFIKRHFGNPAVVGQMAGGVPCSVPIKKPYVDGLLLAGDAAHHCNPLTGGGIYTAMVAGTKAGEVAANAAAKGDTTVKELKKYDKLIDKEIVRPHNRAYRLAKAVHKLTDEQLNATAASINKIPEHKRTMRAVFLKGLSSHPKLLLDIMAAFLH